MQPEKPAMQPEKPAVQPEKPAVEPEKPAMQPEKPAFVDVCEAALKTCGLEKWATVTKDNGPNSAEYQHEGQPFASDECKGAAKAAKVQLDSTDEIKQKVTEFETKAKAAYEKAKKNETADKPAKKEPHHETLQKCKFVVSGALPTDVIDADGKLDTAEGMTDP